MTDFYGRAAATAARILAARGAAVTLTDETAGDYDPATGSVDDETPGVQHGFAAVFEYNTFIRSGVRDEPGTMIKAGDKQMLLSPLNSKGLPITQPAIDSFVTFAGVTYTITSVAPCAPAGTVVFFDCNISGAP